MDIKTTLNIFEHTIKPILLYASEVWGLSLLPQRIQNKNFQFQNTLENKPLAHLKLKFYTPTLAVGRELGRHPISIDAITNSLNYIDSIKLKPEHKLVREALKESIQLKDTYNKSLSYIKQEFENHVSLLKNNLSYSKFTHMKNKQKNHKSSQCYV